MHERLEALKPLLKAGNYDKAAAALKSYREEFPDDWNGKLIEGIVAKLRGDEETFHSIHDEAQAIIYIHGKDAAQIKASPLWKKYHSTWKKVTTVVVIGILTASAIGNGIIIYNHITSRIKWIAEEIFHYRPKYAVQPDLRPQQLPTHDPYNELEDVNRNDFD